MLVNYLKVLREVDMQISSDLLCNALLLSQHMVYTNVSTYFVGPVRTKDGENTGDSYWSASTPNYLSELLPSTVY